MINVEFGIGLPRLDSIAESAQRAEALGYDFLSTGEHVFFHGPIGNGLISLAAAAGATTRIKLMSSITLVPLYPAALLTKLVTSLDVVSSGRFNLGVGVGGEFAREFEACGVPVEERGARTNESLELMLRLWAEDDVRFQGRFNTLSGVTLEPKPTQQPHPPIWISGRSQAAMRRCARQASGWHGLGLEPEGVADAWTNLRVALDEAGRPSEGVPFHLRLHNPIEDMDIDQWRRRFDAYEAAGVTEMVLAPQSGDLDMQRRWLDTMVPALTQ